MVKSKTSISGGEALLATAFLFAATNVLVREMAQMWGDQAQVAVRFALVWLILTTYAHFRGAKASIPRSKMILVIAYSLFVAVAVFFFTLSVQMTTIANTIFMSNATELVGAFLIGTLLLKEKLTTRKFVAIGLSLAGLALYSDALLGGSTGLIFGLLAGATTAICNLFAKKLKGVNTRAVLRIQFGIGALIMLALTLLFSANDIVRTISIEGLAATVLFALILIVAEQLFFYGFAHFDINIASVVLSSQLAFGALIGYFVYHEVPATHELISGLLIACAAILASIGYKVSEKEVEVHG